MKARPILFSTPMINALVEDRKTQTRRVVKQPKDKNVSLFYKGKPICLPPRIEDISISNLIENAKFPYGKVGDLLYVKENFATDGILDHLKPSLLSHDHSIFYIANQEWILGDFDKKYQGVHAKNKGKTRPNIFMPKWASRLTLEITDIRVERLQDISEEDAIAEGCEHPLKDDPDRGLIEACADWVADERTSFARLWKSINGKDSWDKNPFVWVLEFKVHKCNFQKLLNPEFSINYGVQPEINRKIIPTTHQ